MGSNSAVETANGVVGVGYNNVSVGMLWRMHYLSD
jgi:hypothetical protein